MNENVRDKTKRSGQVQDGCVGSVREDERLAYGQTTLEMLSWSCTVATMSFSLRCVLTHRFIKRNNEPAKPYTYTIQLNTTLELIRMYVRTMLIITYEQQGSQKLVDRVGSCSTNALCNRVQIAFANRCGLQGLNLFLHCMSDGASSLTKKRFRKAACSHKGASVECAPAFVARCTCRS